MSMKFANLEWVMLHITYNQEKGRITIKAKNQDSVAHRQED